MTSMILDRSRISDTFSSEKKLLAKAYLRQTASRYCFPERELPRPYRKMMNRTHGRGIITLISNRGTGQAAHAKHPLNELHDRDPPAPLRYLSGSKSFNAAMAIEIFANGISQSSGTHSVD